nr:LapA family protein [Roseospira visakhapatnamensis]
MFAIYNQGPVTLDLRPFSSSLDMPVFWVVLGTLLIGVLLGMLMTWLAQGKYRAMARSYRSQAISLRTEADLARARAEAAEAKANA